MYIGAAMGNVALRVSFLGKQKKAVGGKKKFQRKGRERKIYEVVCGSTPKDSGKEAGGTSIKNRPGSPAGRVRKSLT